MALPALLAAGVVGFILGVIGSDQYEKDAAARRMDADVLPPADENVADNGKMDLYSDGDDDGGEYELCGDCEDEEEYEFDGDADGAKGLS